MSGDLPSMEIQASVPTLTLGSLFLIPAIMPVSLNRPCRGVAQAESYVGSGTLGHILPRGRSFALDIVADQRDVLIAHDTCIFDSPPQ
jgi:hypothetical protein